MTGRSPKYDWAAIRQEYEHGTLSVNAIGAKHDLGGHRIQQHAVMKKWVRPPEAPPYTPKPHPSVTRYGKGSGNWGGPASGTPAGGPALAAKGQSPFAGDSPIAVRKQAGEPGRGIPPTEAATTRRQKVEMALAALERVAKTSDNDNAVVAAANSLLNRLEGMPIQKNINADVGDVSKLSNEEVEAELDAVRRQLAGTGGEGT